MVVSLATVPSKCLSVAVYWQMFHTSAATPWLWHVRIFPIVLAKLPCLPSLSMPRCDTRDHVHHIFLHSVHEVLPPHSLWELGNFLWWRAFSTPLSRCLSRQQGRTGHLAGTQAVFGTHDPPVCLPQPHLQCNLAYKHCYGLLYLCQ